jgi:ketosteroid isomerase-like protein
VIKVNKFCRSEHLARASEPWSLIQRTAEANSALIRGDVDRYLALIEHAEDYTLMAPFGGAQTRGFDTSSEYRATMARFFKSGTFCQEVVATYDSGDLIVLVTIERVRAEVGGLPEQDWSLRVTQVFRREGAEWRLVHRHADPLVHGISSEHAAALARGDQSASQSDKGAPGRQTLA